jgi:predicted dehydrogenase
VESKVKVGVIGCGNISGNYFKHMKMCPILEVAAVSDLDMSRAQAAATETGAGAVSVKDLLADKGIEIVLNLTVPKAHFEVNMAAIAAGKNVHCEKPLATNRQDGRKTIEAAKAKGVLVGCAPDTFLGGGGQTCRKLIEDGWIGRPVAAAAFMLCHGHESWHPSPEFYYEVGGGPMLDMGPYYLSALVNLMGSIKRITGSTRAAFAERTITSQPKYGKVVKVETPTHIAGVMDFASGAIGTIIQSFDVWSHNLPRIEVYGTEGSMVVPDPNHFTGPVMVRRAGAKEWSNVPLTHSDTIGRGIGVADMAYALRSGRKHRASGDLAYHVLDVMCSFEEASKAGKHVDIQSTVAQPAPLPLGLITGELDR